MEGYITFTREAPAKSALIIGVSARLFLCLVSPTTLLGTRSCRDTAAATLLLPVREPRPARRRAALLPSTVGAFGLFFATREPSRLSRAACFHHWGPWPDGGLLIANEWLLILGVIARSHCPARKRADRSAHWQRFGHLGITVYKRCACSKRGGQCVGFALGGTAEQQARRRSDTILFANTGSLPKGCVG